MKKGSEHSSVSSRGAENWTVSSILKKASSYITKLAENNNRSVLATINSNSDENLLSGDEVSDREEPTERESFERSSPL